MSDDADRVSVRRLGPEDWRTKRDLRLAALQQDGRWFGGNYADSAARTPQQWRDWPGGAVFAAYVDDDALGIAAGSTPELRGGQAELIAMWVRPEARGLGVAGRLVSALADWARAAGCTELRLEVKPDNESARRAYGRAGFDGTGVQARDAGNIVMRYRL